MKNELQKHKVLIGLCCHSHFSVIPPCCIPIQGGARLNPPIPETMPDIGRQGDISSKNPTYCELTVLYYMWKNLEAEYYGLCHYRRFFCFEERVAQKYLAKKTLSLRQQRRYFKSEQEIVQLVQKYDVLIPRSEKMGMTVEEHYGSSTGHQEADLKLFTAILMELYPDLSTATKKYLSQDMHYFCNMFLMRRTFFRQYCQMLFSVLSEFDRRKTANGETVADRTDGYLGERFLGIYITFLREQKVRIIETARIDVECSLSKRILYQVLPPESHRRIWGKMLVKRLRKNMKSFGKNEALR